MNEREVLLKSPKLLLYYMLTTAAHHKQIEFCCYGDMNVPGWRWYVLEQERVLFENRGKLSVMFYEWERDINAHNVLCEKCLWKRKRYDERRERYREDIRSLVYIPVIWKCHYIIYVFRLLTAGQRSYEHSTCYDMILLLCFMLYAKECRYNQ